MRTRRFPRWQTAGLLMVFLGVLIVAVPRLSPVVNVLAGEWDDTNFDKRSVDLSEIMSGGPPKDGIPAIDRPRFVSAAAAAEWLDPREPVIALRIGQTARAYPIQILIWHEIVNDTLAGVPVAVTFCPLCNASIVFNREHKGQLLDFGTTGRLRLSDMVMYDRPTQSWWQQFTGEGIVGEMTGEVLVQIPAQIVAFEEYRTLYPRGDVLSRDTGFLRRYGENPYVGYDNIEQYPFLFHGKIDKRLPPMERVLSVRGAGATVLFPYRLLESEPLVQHDADNLSMVVFAHRQHSSPLDQRSIADSREIAAAFAFSRQVGDRQLDFELRAGEVHDVQTGSRWDASGLAIEGELAGSRLQQIDSGVHFAFAWLAFDPEAVIYAP